MNMLVGHKAYPMSMALFFCRAMRKLGHNVYNIGPYSGAAIPWPGNPSFPQYMDTPTVDLPEHLGVFSLNAALNHPALKGKEIDVVWSFDAGFRLVGSLEGAITVLYGTDPHALNYQPYYREYNYFFSAQKQNLLDRDIGGIWVPLAYDPEVHRCEKPINAENRPIDVCFIGVMGYRDDPNNAYRNRLLGLDKLKENGHSVFAETGIIFEECTKIYNQAKIAYNWSSSWDLPMRFFEGMAYGCCVITNRLPFIEELGFFEGEDYIAFDSFDVLSNKVKWLLETGAWMKIAENGKNKLLNNKHTYADRVQQMIDYMSVKHNVGILASQ